MNLEPELKLELVQYVENWLRVKGLLEPNMVLDITLRGLPDDSSRNTNDPEETISLQKFISLIPRQMRVRWGNIFNNCRIHHLDQLLSYKLDDIHKLRNIGELAIKALRDALESAGLGDSLLAREISEYYSEARMSVREEAERSEVQPLTESDWESMIFSLAKRKGIHTKSQVGLVNKLELNGNSPSLASKVFPRRVRGSFRKDLISLINQRWSSDELPYRMKFTSITSAKLKWEGEVQIRVYKSKS